MGKVIGSDLANVVYSDGNIVITLTSLYIGETQYNFSDIVSYKSVTIARDRKPFITLVALGAILAVVAQLNLIPNYLIYNLQLKSYTFSQLNLITGFGIMLSIIGLLIIGLRPNHYAIQINSGGKNINLLVSKRKGYIKAIETAVGIGLRYTNRSSHNPLTILPNSLA